MYSKPAPPEAISHRGLHRSLPENSLPAFEAAIQAGAQGIELDIHASVDNVLFVHHDPTVRTAEGQAAIAELNAAALSALRLTDEAAIPTLDETLEAIGDRARVYIELKGRSIEQTLTRCLKRHSAFLDNYAVHSFDHRSAKRMLELCPNVRSGILQGSYPLDSCSILRMAGAADLWQHVEFIDDSLVQDIHSCGGRVIAWTANTEQQWETLSAAGVDGICTDFVDAYVQWAASSTKP